MDTTLTQSAVLPLASGLTLCDDGLIRPTWAAHDELLRSYYDTEWGLPIHDEAGVSHLGELVWSYRPPCDPRPHSGEEVPTRLPESVALAADLKSHGFKFVGPTTMLALMAAIGIVNTDIVGTHRRPR